MSNQNPLSRRDLIRLALVSTWGAVLAACSKALGIEVLPTPLPAATDTPASLPSPTPAPTDTPTPTATPTAAPPPTSTPTSTLTPTETHTPTPACFRLLEPPDGAALPALGRVTFAWEAFPGAASYRLEITFPSGWRVEAETSETSHERYLASLPAAGAFSWQVVALDAEGGLLCRATPFNFTKPETKPSSTPKPDKDGQGGNPPGGGPGSTTDGSGSSAGAN